ncbi:serine hydrolase domain-containing protein [Vallitalea guaymasensis]|uniref:serine hydrolase domain-containing protein n=1 Tax=Vallitalea guaymasensis TaxID=1185412 RepID=UPI000DE2E8AE|nr:serine hydrolase domain-containing protein [Vallitalea guaymasensis]
MNLKKVTFGLIMTCMMFNLFCMIARASYDETDFNKIDKIVKEHIGNDVPGASVIVKKNGETMFQKAYGYANLEDKKSIELDKTVFEWGSISKTFIWISLIQLEEKGIIKFDEDVRVYLPKDFLKNLKYESKVTVLDLMNHTAGFEDYFNDIRMTDREAFQPLAKTLMDKQPLQVYEPGELSGYSNWGAALGALIVERSSGMEYSEYVRKNILIPLDLEEVSIHPFGKDISGLYENKATGYSKKKNGLEDAGWMHLSVFPAGSFNGTALDLAKYADALANRSELLFKDNKVFLDKLLSSVTLTGQGEVKYGFWRYPGKDSIYGHEGGTYGFKTQIWFNLKTKESITIIVNAMDSTIFSELMTSLEPIELYEENNSIHLDKYEVSSIVGDYIPARSVYSNPTKIYGDLQLINIRQVDEERISLKMPFFKKKAIYEYKGDGIFYNADMPLQERIIRFKKNEDMMIMNYRIAHDYVPAPNNRTFFYIILRIVLLSISILYFIISLIFAVRKYIGNRNTKQKRKCLLRMSLSIIFIIMVLQSGYFFFGCLSTYNVQSIHLTITRYSNTVLSLLGLLFAILYMYKNPEIKKNDVLAMVLYVISIYIFIQYKFLII